VLRGGYLNLKFMPLSKKTFQIEITYSNSETAKLGVKVGDRFEAYREYYEKPTNRIIDKKNTIVHVLKQQCWFKVGDVDCVAYKCEHDEDAMLLVTTCKLVKE
jgi:hypothetical protein